MIPSFYITYKFICWSVFQKNYKLPNVLWTPQYKI